MIESVSYKCYNLLYAIFYYDIVSDEYQGITKLKLAKFIQIFIHQLLLLREKIVDLYFRYFFTQSIFINFYLDSSWYMFYFHLLDIKMPLNNKSQVSILT